MALTLTQKLTNYYHKFTAADAKTRLTLLKRSVWHHGRWLPIKILLWIPALLVLGLLRSIRPLVKVRIGALHSSRIGSLAMNTELYLRRQHRSKADREWHVFLTGKPANRQLLTMIKRRVSVSESHVLFWFYRVMRSCTSNASFWVELPCDGNEFDEFNNISPQLEFTEDEEARGQSLLTNMDIEPGTSFVCFHARDRAYLHSCHNWRSGEEWAYHDYRDSNIYNCQAAMEYVTSLGLCAIRMGHTVESPLATNNHRIIDYATLYHSDFADSYLSAKCKFFLGNTAGISIVPHIFDVPTARANWIPLKYLPVGRRELFIPKKLWSVERKRFLRFREIFACGADQWMQTQQYTQAGIEVIENTSDEILALAQEMDERVDGTWNTTDEDEVLQQRFRALISPDHHSYGFPSRIGAEFLRRNRDLLV